MEKKKKKAGMKMGHSMKKKKADCKHKAKKSFQAGMSIGRNMKKKSTTKKKK